MGSFFLGNLLFPLVFVLRILLHLSSVSGNTEYIPETILRRRIELIEEALKKLEHFKYKKQND
jgi:hypothetical protein